MTGTTTLTLGGLLAALIILSANLHPWWTGNREIKQLAAFGKGFLAAACAAACPGGILGWAHSRTGTVANGAGERAGAAATGTTSSDRKSIESCKCSLSRLRHVARNHGAAAVAGPADD